MIRFSANLGFLFTEGATLLEQYELARQAGFKAVEHPFPSKGEDHQELLKIKSQCNLDLTLVNISTDPEAKFGCASFPGQQEAFKSNFHSTVDFAKSFDCKKIHLMSGKLEHAPTKEHHETFLSNLKYAATYLEQENIVGVIEPINPYSVPGYFLCDFTYAIDTIKAVGSQNIKLMVDLFHLQMIRGNIVNSLKEFQPFIGHVQIAQAPNRNEPNSAGELNLKYILDQVEQIGYNDWIGCEYKPITSNFEWINEFGFKLWADSEFSLFLHLHFMLHKLLKSIKI